MEMTFTLEMDRPIIKGEHYISPGGYCLRFYGNGGTTKEVDFDFFDYYGTIVGEKCLECTVRGLDTSSFPNSVELKKLLGGTKYEWAEFFVYTGEEEEPEINPVRTVGGITIVDGDKEYKLKDYVFPEAKIDLTQEQVTSLMRVMKKAITFCTCRQMFVKGGGIRFYESESNIYLCSQRGGGYCYFSETGEVKAIGFKGSPDSMASAKTVIIGTVAEIMNLMPFPVRSITIPYGTIKGGYCRQSIEELGSYDIVLKAERS